VQLYVLHETRPEHGDCGAAAEGGIDTGASDLEQTSPLSSQAPDVGEIELAFRIEASRFDCLGLGQQSRRGDHLARVQLAHEQVMAVIIVGVSVEPCNRTV
jgi:hypothetical protein